MNGKYRNFLRLSLALLLTLTMCISLAACGDTGNDPDKTAAGFTLSFDVDGKIVKTVRTAGNEIITPPANPHRAGFVFDGWFFDKDRWTRGFDGNSFKDNPLKSNTTIYAKWEIYHNYNGGEYTEGDCRNKGYTRFTCSDCGEFYDEEDAGFGAHKYAADSGIRVEGDCLNKEYTTYVCLVCGESVTETDENFGEHKFDKENATHTDGDCKNKGYTRYICMLCGETSDVPDTDFGSHAYDPETNVCGICGEIKVNEGLSFTLNNDNATYTVSKGTCGDAVINVPQTYGNLPVTVIGDFKNCGNVKRFIIHENVKRITERAFWYCSGLIEVKLPESVKEIGAYAFNSCRNLKEIYLPGNIVSVGEDAFYGCGGLKKIYCSASDPSSHADSPAAGWSGSWKGDCQAATEWGYTA